MGEKVKSYPGSRLLLCIRARPASAPGPHPCRLEVSEDRCFSDRVNTLPPPGDDMHLHPRGPQNNAGASGGVRTPDPGARRGAGGAQPHFCAQGQPPPAWAWLEEPPGPMLAGRGPRGGGQLCPSLISLHPSLYFVCRKAPRLKNRLEQSPEACARGWLHGFQGQEPNENAGPLFKNYSGFKLAAARC